MSQEQQPSEQTDQNRVLEQTREYLDKWTYGDKVWAGVTIAIVLIIVIISVGGYEFGWKWAGITKPNRTFWDWLSLLGVPTVLALGGYLFNRSENRRTNQQTKLDREVALGHRQEDALRAYLDGMSKLLIDEDLPSDKAQQRSDHLSTVVRAWTLTVLEELTVPEKVEVDVQDSGRRKRRVLRFLYEAGLIGNKDVKNRATVVDLSRASLADADLSGADLSGADLRRVDLGEADRSEANLSGTDLRGANLEGIRIRVKDPKGKKTVTYKTLDNVELANKGPILDFATMPEGQKYEAWLKSKGDGELTESEKVVLERREKATSDRPHEVKCEDWLTCWENAYIAMPPALNEEEYEAWYEAWLKGKGRGEDGPRRGWGELRCFVRSLRTNFAKGR